jgi:hypothetical protein
MPMHPARGSGFDSGSRSRSDLTPIGAVRLVLGGVVEYVRWTQLLPLFTAWLLATLGVLVVVLLAFQGGADALLAGLESRARELPWLERLAGRIPNVNTDGSTSVDSAAVARWIGGAWMGFSAVLFVGSGIRRSLWGAPPRRSLRQSLAMVLAALGIYWGILQVVRALAPISFGDSHARWAVMTGAMLLLVGVVSTWSLGVSHLLHRVRDALLAEEAR